MPDIAALIQDGAANPWLYLPVAVIGIGVLLLKIAAWWLTGSVALLSDALESTVNVATAVAALIAIQIASKPADADHPYGHHKAEFFSAVLEGGDDHARRDPHHDRGLQGHHGPARS